MNEVLCTRLVKRRATSFDPSWDEYMDPLPCEFCGSWLPLERHHRKFRSRGGLWTPSNIILLCSWHHVQTTDEMLPGSGLNVQFRQDPLEVPVTVWYSDTQVLFDDEGGYAQVKGLDNA